MKTAASLLVLLLVSTPVGLSQQGQASSERSVVGVVSDLKGKALIRESPTATPREIIKGTNLREGDELLCQEHGLLKIRVFGREKEVVIKPDFGWYPIPPLRSLVGANVAKLLTIMQFKRAGRKRSFASIISSPQRGGIIRPARLVFRWTPFRERVSLRLSLKLVGKNNPFWTEVGIDGAAGQFVSEKAQRLVKKVQKENYYVDVEFSLTPQGGRLHQILFRVMSSREESSLLSELSRWDEISDFTRNMGRAYAFSRRQLYDEAAAEFEASLTDAPESLDLLRAAIKAYCLAGNKSRAEELARRLPPGYLAPNESCVAVSQK